MEEDKRPGRGGVIKAEDEESSIDDAQRLRVAVVRLKNCAPLRPHLTLFAGEHSHRTVHSLFWLMHAGFFADFPESLAQDVPCQAAQDRETHVSAPIRCMPWVCVCVRARACECVCAFV